MSLFEQINKDITNAMKARDKEKLEALRNIKKVMIEAKTALGVNAELKDEESLKIISKLAKQGLDSAKIYKEQNRPDLYEVEVAQVKVYESYLPAKLTDEELTIAIKSIIEKTGATSVKEMGKIMGIAGKELSGKADGKEISDKVKALLS